MCPPSHPERLGTDRIVRKQPDGFTQDFDSLIELPQGVATGTMGQLSLVTARDDPFALDLKLDHTRDHVECPACRQANKALQLTGADLAAMTFGDASAAWKLLRRQSARLRARTHEADCVYFSEMGKFFGRLRLCDMTPGHVRAYQITRLNNTMRVAGSEEHPWGCAAAHSTINHEIATLGLMMKFASLWHRIKPYYFPLPVPK